MSGKFFLCAIVAASLLLSAATAQQAPSVTVRLEEGFVNDIVNDLIPKLESFVDTYVKKGESTNHYSYGDIHFSGATVADFKVAFVAPSTISLTLYGVGINVAKTSFSVFEKIFHHKFGCSGDFWGSVSGSTVTLQMQMEAFDEKLQVANVQSSIVFGHLDVQQSTHGVCKMLEKLISLFMGNINSLISKELKKYVPGLMAKKAQSEINKYFMKSVLQVYGAPYVIDDSLSVTLQILPHTVRNIVPPYNGTLPFHPRDVQAYITADSLNALIAYAQGKGLLQHLFDLPAKYNTTFTRLILPAAYAACPDCLFAATLQVEEPPKCGFEDGTISYESTKTILGIAAVNKAKKTFPIADFDVVGTLEQTKMSIVDGNKIYFNLALNGFNITGYKSHMGHIGKEFAKVLTGILANDLIPGFNLIFKGITIPAVDGITLSKVVIQATSGLLGLATDVALPPGLTAGAPSPQYHDRAHQIHARKN